MTTLNELKEEVEDLRRVVRMADSDSVETKQLLRAQTQLMMALRSGQLGLNIEQKNIKVVLEHQAEALGGMLLSLTSMQDRFNSLGMDVAELRTHADRMDRRHDQMDQRQERMDRRQERMDLRQDGMDQRQERMDQRQERMDLRQDGMDQRQERMDLRQDGMDQRQERMDQRQERMDRNIVAIMRHLGMEPPEES